jgi:hypothetical protein
MLHQILEHHESPAPPILLVLLEDQAVVLSLQLHCFHVDDNPQATEQGKHHGDMNTYLAMLSSMLNYLFFLIFEIDQPIEVPISDVQVLGSWLKALLVNLS